MVRREGSGVVLMQHTASVTQPCSHCAPVCALLPAANAHQCVLCAH